MGNQAHSTARRDALIKGVEDATTILKRQPDGRTIEALRESFRAALREYDERYLLLPIERAMARLDTAERASRPYRFRESIAAALSEASLVPNAIRLVHGWRTGTGTPRP